MEHEVQQGEAALIDQLVDLASQLSDRLSEPCIAQGLMPSRFAVLHAVADRADQGCSQADLAKQLKLSESNICALVERMRAAGLLFRFRSKTDRRKCVLMLSEEGRELAEAIASAQKNHAISLMSVLSPEEQRSLSRFVERLLEHLNGSIRPKNEKPDVWESMPSHNTRRAS